MATHGSGTVTTRPPASASSYVVVRGSAAPLSYAHGIAEGAAGEAQEIRAAIGVGIARGRAANESTVDSRRADMFRRGIAIGAATAPSGPTDTEEPTVVAVLAEGVVDPDFDVATHTALTLDVEDETGVASIVVHCSIATVDGWLAVYRRGDFVAPFDAYSFTSTPAAGVTRLHVRHNDGWPPGSVSLTTDVVDSGGNLDAE